MSVLVSTAYLDEAAMCHDVYIINKGEILAQGTPEALTEPYKNRVYFARADGRTPRQMLDLASHSSMILDSTPSGDRGEAAFEERRGSYRGSQGTRYSGTQSSTAEAGRCVYVSFDRSG